MIVTEKGLRINVEKQKASETAINEYVQNGCAKELTSDEFVKIEICSKSIIPHHPVFKSISTSAKVRIVFDTSAKTVNGLSLNDRLLKGPNQWPDITAVFLGFCMNLIALNGDLKKMFCQTAVAPSCQPFQLYS